MLRTQSVSAPCTNVQGVHPSMLDLSEIPMDQNFWDERLFRQGNSWFSPRIKKKLIDLRGELTFWG